MESILGCIVGNDILKERLMQDISGNSLSHAYILEGPSGSGRHTLALSISAAISCENAGVNQNIPCTHCKSCEKILSGRSPDIITLSLEGDKSTIGIDAIRKIKNDIHIAPNDLDIKVYIIENADKMTVQAQNAFLLSLEEPPEYVMFFLICENSNSLLETVRSRAPALRAERLSNAQVESYILEKDRRAVQLKESSESELRTIVFSSGGCIGKALELLDPKRRKALLDQRALTRSIISMLLRADTLSVLECISSLGTKRVDAVQNLNLLQSALRDLILLKKSEQISLCFFDDPEEAAELSTHFTSDSLLSLYDASEQAIRDLEANANLRLALLSMMQRAGLI